MSFYHNDNISGYSIVLNNDNNTRGITNLVYVVTYIMVCDITCDKFPMESPEPHRLASEIEACHTCCRAPQHTR